MTPQERWQLFLDRANSVLNRRRGAKSAAAKALGLRRQDMHRILKGEQEPRAGIALALHDAVRRELRQSLHLSSQWDAWQTPQWLYDALNELFHFEVDAAADASNAKCAVYFDREADGLSQNWLGRRVWCNPPYREPAWFQKALYESQAGAVVVMLVAARTDTRAWHDVVEMPGNEVIFLRGRLRFSHAEQGAPFPSALVVMGGDIPASAVRSAIDAARPVVGRGGKLRSNDGFTSDVNESTPQPPSPVA